MLAAEVTGVPTQHVAEQHRRFVVEVVAGREHVVTVRERGVVEHVPLRQPARRARRARGSPSTPSGTSNPYVVAQVDLEQRPAVLAARTRARTRPTRRSTRRCRGRRTGRRRRSRARAAAATARASPCRPTPRRARGRPGAIMSWSSIARRTCSPQWRVKQSAQKPALWRRTSMTAGSRHRRHFTARACPDTTGRISTTSSSREVLVAWSRACRCGSRAPTPAPRRDRVRSCATVARRRNARARGADCAGRLS